MSELGEAIDDLQRLAGLPEEIRAQGLLLLGLSRDRFQEFGRPTIVEFKGGLKLTWQAPEKTLVIRVLPERKIKYYAENGERTTFYDESGWVALE